MVPPERITALEMMEVDPDFEENGDDEPWLGWAANGPRCLIPGFDGAMFSIEWKEALWARFFMEAPRRQRRSVERYSIVKRA
jgi:hypothetical protein